MTKAYLSIVIQKTNKHCETFNLQRELLSVLRKVGEENKIYVFEMVQSHDIW